ncbi:MAG: hypothetical protein V1733_08490, partial [bacterium]
MHRTHTFLPILIFFCTLLTCYPDLTTGQSHPPLTVTGTLQWKPVETIEAAPGRWVKILTFSGSSLADGFGQLPCFFYRQPLPDENSTIEELRFSSLICQPVTPEELLAIDDPERIPEVIEPKATRTIQRKQPFFEISFLPFRRNSQNGLIEKVLSFELSGSVSGSNASPFRNSPFSYAEHSVLATGLWYKFAVSSNGIYRITYQDLLQADINPSSVDPRTIRLCGNG